MTGLAKRRKQPFTGRQLDTVIRLLRDKAGITIESPAFVIEQNLLERMAQLSLDDAADYLSLLDDSFNARAEWLALVDLMTVKETRFFRQPAAMDLVAEYVDDFLSQQSHPAPLSFWSAGCSTGQELYSLAMVVEHTLMQRDRAWEWHGVGTDISFQAINTAQQGCYGESALQHIPLRYRHAFVQASAENRWEICPAIKARTHFVHSNLRYLNEAFFSDFNLVFCQNVLIYFDKPTQLQIIDQLVQRLKPGGLLVLGAGEDVGWTNKNVRSLARSGVCAYKKIGGLADGC